MHGEIVKGISFLCGIMPLSTGRMIEAARLMTPKPYLSRLSLCGLAFLFGLLLSSSTTPPARADTPVVKRYKTTMSYPASEKGFIFVQVQTEDGRTTGGFTGTFLLDTGTSLTSVTDEFAKKMGLTPIPGVDKNGGPLMLGGKQAQTVVVPKLYVGTFPLINPSCLVLSQKSFSALAGRQVDGILGANLLTLFPMYFDFLQRKITVFYPGPLTDSEMRDLGMDDARVLPVTDVAKGGFQFACPVVVANGANKAQENLVVDTGAMGTIISGDTARRLQLQPVGNDRNSPTFFGDLSVKQARLPSLSLGDLETSDLLIRYTEGLSASFPAHIGMDVLSRFRLLLDFNQKKMYLKPISASARVVRPAVP